MAILLVALGVLRVAGAPSHYEYLPTVAFWALFVAGAYRYADRPIPRWLVPASLGICALFVPALLEPSLPVAGWLSVLSAWGAAIVSAAVVHRAAKARDASRLHRLLPLGFLGTVLLGNFDHFALERDVAAAGAGRIGTVIEPVDVGAPGK